MKKLWILVVLTLLLTGCADLQLACGVNRKKEAFIQLALEGSWKDAPEGIAADLQTGCELLAKHYRNKLGFEVEESYTEETFSLHMTYTEKAESYDAAFDLLEELLRKEELTPFVQVNSDAQRKDTVSGYGLDVTLDIGRIVENGQLELLPGDLQRFFYQGLENSNGSLSLMLPGTTVIDGTGDAVRNDGIVTVQSPIDLNGTTQLKLSTSAVIEGGELQLNAHEKNAMQTERMQNLMFLCGAVAVLGLLLLIVCLCLRKKKGSKKNASFDNNNSEKSFDDPVEGKEPDAASVASAETSGCASDISAEE